MNGIISVNGEGIYMNTQNTLKELRQRTGLSQAGFAKKFSIPLSTYEHWEMNVRKPPIYVVKMIALILDYETRFGEVHNGT